MRIPLVTTLQASTRILPNGTFAHTTKVAPTVPLRGDHTPQQYEQFAAHIQSKNV